MPDAASELQDYATSVRYPDEDAETISLGEANSAIEQAKLIRNFVFQQRLG